MMVSKTIPTIGRRNSRMKPFAIYMYIYFRIISKQNNNKNNWRKTHAALVKSSKTSNAYAVRWPKNSIFTRIFMYPTNPFWDEKCRQQKLAKTNIFIYKYRLLQHMLTTPFQLYTINNVQPHSLYIMYIVCIGR